MKKIKDLFSFRKNKYRIHIAAISHIGYVRQNNEDNLYYQEHYLDLEHENINAPVAYTITTDTPQAVAVFDGMGGESAGELASYTAAKAFHDTIKQYDATNYTLSMILQDINKKVYQASLDEKYKQIGTTATVLIFDKKTAVIGNLGDSPCYQLNSETLSRISLPHTNEEFLKSQNIHRKPGLTQFLGISPEDVTLEPYEYSYELHAGDKYLICSDGLTDMVSETDIEQILRQKKTVAELTQQLLDKALECGGHDNTTIILCEIQ